MEFPPEPNCSMALIFELISGFNRKSTRPAATREPSRKGKKGKKRDRELPVRSTIFSFTLERERARGEGEERRRRKKKIVRPNGLHGWKTIEGRRGDGKMADLIQIAEETNAGLTKRENSWRGRTYGIRVDDDSKRGETRERDKEGERDFLLS